MTWLRWIVVALAAWDACYMVFDGARALLVGDYLTPKSGPYAGQLGPWHHLATAVGIEPRSTLMKSIFLAYGVVWLPLTVCFALGYRWAWWAMLTAAIGSAWNLFFGTMTSLVIVILLLLPPLRPAYSG